MIVQSTLKSSKAKEFYLSRDFTPIFIYNWLLDGIPEYKNKYDAFIHRNILNFIFMTADIHLTLNKMVGKQNVMIDGKYKKARVYLFETKSLYIAVQAETGDRGASWSVLEKTNLNTPSSHYTDDLLGWSRDNLKELSDFMREMCWSLLENHEDNKKDYLVSSEEYLSELQKEFGKFTTNENLKA
jgi:hypothetical protein